MTQIHRWPPNTTSKWCGFLSSFSDDVLHCHFVSMAHSGSHKEVVRLLQQSCGAARSPSLLHVCCLQSGSVAGPLPLLALASARESAAGTLQRLFHCGQLGMQGSSRRHLPRICRGCDLSSGVSAVQCRRAAHQHHEACPGPRAQTPHP